MDINNEEIIEEIKDEELAIETEEVAENKNEEIKDDTKEEIATDEEETPKKSKVPLIVILSILLVLDIAALVIYLIGVEKVIGFIK